MCADAGWHLLKTQLDYKSKAMQAVFLEVNESYTTQTCSCCGCISSNSPKGRAGQWSCPECGATHDRDINAAKKTFSRSDMSVSQEESPSFRAGRMSNYRFSFHRFALRFLS